jgi:integrase
MKLFKRPNSPYWWYQFTVEGKRFRGSTKRLIKDKAEAQAFVVKEYNRHLNLGVSGVKQPITLHDAFKVTLDEVEGQTLRLYRSAYVQLAAHFGPDAKMHEISEAKVDAYIAQRRKAGRVDNTIRGDLKALLRASKRVSRQYRVNPDLHMPKTLKVFTKTRYLSDEEERLVLKKLKADPTITGEKAYDLAIVLLDTGMRLMEAVNLSWADIDLTRREIEVYRTKTKTLSIVPISDRAYEVFKRLHNQDAPFPKMEWAIRRLRKVIHEVCNGNQRVVDQRGKATVHSLRDTFASRLVQKGLHLNELAKLLGHTNTAMTAKYAQLEQTGVVEKARRLMNG